jgi:hypothetical protein
MGLRKLVALGGMKGASRPAARPANVVLFRRTGSGFGGRHRDRRRAAAHGYGGVGQSG